MNIVCNLFAERLYKSCEEMLNTIHASNELPTVRRNISSLINSFETCNPISDALDYIDSGAFKETYELSPSLVIKFCTENNNTEEEINLLANLEEPFRKLFLETSYLRLPFPIPETCTESDEDEILVDCVIQPKVIIASSLSLDDWKDYIPNYNYDDILDVGFHTNYIFDDPDWYFALIAVYGEEYTDAFCKYCRANYISDLHLGNVGLLREGEVYIPVILDWMS